MIEFIAATRCDRAGFLETPLGPSFRRLSGDAQLSASIAFANRRGLPDIYNQQLRAKTEPDIVAFVHDDVWLEDFFIGDRLLAALERFDIVGVAGNTRLPEHHVSWIFRNARGEWDRPYLSGAIAYGEPPAATVAFYGDSARECELLDGVLLATRRSRLLAKQVSFDPRFAFHFYDLDFCRSARAAGLTLGTWPLAICHSSIGAYGSRTWQQGMRAYRQKSPAPSGRLRQRRDWHAVRTTSRESMPSGATRFGSNTPHSCRSDSIRCTQLPQSRINSRNFCDRSRGRIASTATDSDRPVPRLPEICLRARDRFSRS